MAGCALLFVLTAAPQSAYRFTLRRVLLSSCVRREHGATRGSPRSTRIDEDENRSRGRSDHAKRDCRRRAAEQLRCNDLKPRRCKISTDPNR